MQDVSRRTYPVQQTNRSSKNDPYEVDKQHIKKCTTEELWKKHPHVFFNYAYLTHLARNNKISTIDNEKFYKLEVPLYLQHPEKKRHSLGWKCHLSVEPLQLLKAYSLVSPILVKYGLLFKIINLAKRQSQRLSGGAQITIYLEKNNSPMISADILHQMIKEVNDILGEKGIQPGKIPDSDAKMHSCYFSMRNDKMNSVLCPNNETYISAKLIGSHYNPAHLSNPYSALIWREEGDFDPLLHFVTLEKSNEYALNNASELLIYFTTMACVREYTVLGSLSDDEVTQFFYQFAKENGGNVTDACLKDDYKNDPSILLAVKHAVALTFIYEIAALKKRNILPSYVKAAQLIENYPYNNSFKQVLYKIENHYNQIESNEPLHNIDCPQFWMSLLADTLELIEQLSI